MVKYECYRCGYTINHKTKITMHIGRKYRCEPLFNDIDLDECNEYILQGLIYEEYVKLNKESIKTTHKQPSNNIKTSYEQQNNNKKTTKGEFECQFCEKILTYKQSYYRHLKICKDKKQEEEANDSMNELVKILNIQINEFKHELIKKDKELEKRDKDFLKRDKELEKRDKDFKKELEKRDKQIDELIKKAGINNSTITQNIQNNIKLLAYKDTDISKLTDKDILNCMNHSNMCVPHLIKMIHFDPKKPENHNIYISNLKNGYIMVYDDGKWDTKNREEVIIDMIDDKQGLIEERIENWLEKGKKYPSIMKKFMRYVEKKDNNIVINKIKEEIKLMLFNNKLLIKERLN